MVNKGQHAVRVLCSTQRLRLQRAVSATIDRKCVERLGEDGWRTRGREETDQSSSKLAEGEQKGGKDKEEKQLVQNRRLFNSYFLSLHYWK